MKKIIFIALLIIGCAPTTPEVLQPDNNPISTKLKSLNIGIEGSDVMRYSTNITDYQTPFNTIFRRTIKQNICQQSIDKWGYMDFNITFNKSRPYAGIITALSLLPTPIAIISYPLILLGIDNFFFVHFFEADIGIYNSNKMLIKEYTIKDEILTTSGMVNWKRNNSNIFFSAKYLSDIKVMNSIMNKLSSEISKDVQYINSELEKVGKIN